MKSLEDLLRTKAKSGDLNHVSMGINADGTWWASYRGVPHQAHRHVEGTDLVDALFEVLTGTKVTPAAKAKRAAVVKPVAPADYDPLGDLM